MKHMIIDGIECPFDKERNVLEVARNNGIDIPSLCYCENLSIYGGCRLCLVETDRGALEASCTIIPKDGMVIYTNTEKLRKRRRILLELLLSNHKEECSVCEMSDKCKLREYATRYGVNQVRFPVEYCDEPVDDSSPAIVRDPSKCILCGQCVRMCEEIQNVHAIDFAERGKFAYVGCGFGDKLAETKCVGCGQCAAVCPTGALTVKNETKKMWRFIDDKNKKVVVQIAPAVRVGIGEEFGLPAGESAIGKIVTALKRMGADVVFDTSLTADLTIMEESAEFLNKLETGAKLPMFTSCCPGWIKHIENTYPEIMPQVSTCGSPMEMFGALIRNYYKDEDVYSVAIMPCTAKKAEAARPELEKDGKRLIDLVLTTQELVRMIKESGIDFKNLPDTPFDEPFAQYTGGGVIFGATGGVTEAVIRHVLADKSGETLAKVAECGVRGLEGTKAFEVTAGDVTLKIAVVSGLKNADAIIEKVQSGEEFFHFIEVMACPNGCIGGGGQPPASNLRKSERFTGLFAEDASLPLRCSEMNPDLKAVYDNVGDRAHELFHIHYPSHHAE